MNLQPGILALDRQDSFRVASEAGVPGGWATCRTRVGALSQEGSPAPASLPALLNRHSYVSNMKPLVTKIVTLLAFSLKLGSKVGQAFHTCATNHVPRSRTAIRNPLPSTHVALTECQASSAATKPASRSSGASATALSWVGIPWHLCASLVFSREHR